MDYKTKYLKYKKKYLASKKKFKGGSSESTKDVRDLIVNSVFKPDATVFVPGASQMGGPLAIITPPSSPRKEKNNEIKILEEQKVQLQEKLSICEGEKKNLMKILASYNVDVKREHLIGSLLPHSELCESSFFPSVGPFIYNEFTNLTENEINEFKNYKLDPDNLELKENKNVTTLNPQQIMVKNFIGFLNSNKGGRLFFGIGDDSRAIGISSFNKKYIDELQIKIQDAIFNTIMAYDVNTRALIGYVDPNKLNFVWHWVYNYEPTEKEITAVEDEDDEDEEMKKKIADLEETISPFLKTPSLPHRWILELQVAPAKTNYIYMDKNNNIWYRMTGATQSKTLCEAEIILAQREEQVESEVIVSIAPNEPLHSLI